MKIRDQALGSEADVDEGVVLSIVAVNDRKHTQASPTAEIGKRFSKGSYLATRPSNVFKLPSESRVRLRALDEKDKY